VSFLHSDTFWKHTHTPSALRGPVQLRWRRTWQSDRHKLFENWQVVIYIYGPPTVFLSIATDRFIHVNFHDQSFMSCHSINFQWKKNNRKFFAQGARDTHGWPMVGNQLKHSSPKNKTRQKKKKQCWWVRIWPRYPITTPPRQCAPWYVMIVNALAPGSCGPRLKWVKIFFFFFLFKLADAAREKGTCRLQASGDRVPFTLSFDERRRCCWAVRAPASLDVIIYRFIPYIWPIDRREASNVLNP
jgi:hypothetical protein